MGTTKPTTGAEQPTLFSLFIKLGKAASDDEVPSTISNSSFKKIINLKILKPIIFKMPPKINTINSKQVK